MNEGGEMREGIGRPASVSQRRDHMKKLLVTSIVAARVQIEACARLLREAEAAALANHLDTAADYVLDAEPRMYEARTILDASLILRRVVMAEAFPGNSASTPEP